MKRCLSFFVALLLFSCLFSVSASEMKSSVDKGGRKYFYPAPDDPFAVRMYVLDNGLTVYLSKNAKEPRINSLIAVRAGSSDDPAASTGLAHYFEHLMFKGSSKIGTVDYGKEKKLLDEIEALFERLRSAEDEGERKKIFAEIDAKSYEAAKYGNDEYWLLAQTVGMSDVNAYTSYDETCYVCDFQSNELERVLTLEAERFDNVSLRRFHTELETVYEEFNRAQDSDNKMAMKKLFSLTFGTHPYGRAVIGLPEHLKKPSVRDVHAFFKQYYVPGNMAIILAGDLDYEKTISLIEKHFGKNVHASVKTFPEKREKIESGSTLPEEKRTEEFFGPESEKVFVAFKFAPDRKTNCILYMIDGILSNGNCGIFDRDLILPFKVQAASSSFSDMRDGSIFILSGKPKEGQTLEEVRSLLLSGLEKVRKGDFDEKLLRSIVSNYRFAVITLSEDRFSAPAFLADAFIRSQNLSAIYEADALEKITKDEIVDFANRFFRNEDAFTLYKRTGELTGKVYADKPEITKLAPSEEISAFGRELISMEPEAPCKPVFPDVKNDLKTIKGPNAWSPPFYGAKNTSNKRFSIRFVFDGGKRNDRLLSLAFGYLDFLGTSKYTAAEFGSELYSLASKINYSSSEYESTITVIGLDGNFVPTLKLLHHFLTDCKADKEAYSKYVDAIIKSRENEYMSLNGLKNAGVSYALYGKDNPFRYRMTEAELRAVNPEELVSMVHSLVNQWHETVYYGPLDAEEAYEKVRDEKLSEAHCSKRKIKDKKTFKIVPREENVFYVLDYPSSQAILYVLRADEIPDYNDAKLNAFKNIYNSSHKVFTELREKQALAYSAASLYSLPTILPDNYSYQFGFIGTHPDKLSSAAAGLLEMMDLPSMTKEDFLSAKNEAVSEMRNSRVSPENLYDVMFARRRFAIPYDVDLKRWEALNAFSFEDLKIFSDGHFKGKRFAAVLIGPAKGLDLEMLKKYGKVVMITPDEIFPER